MLEQLLVRAIKFPWTKKLVSRTAALLLDNVCVTVRLRVQIRVRLDQPLMNWTSTREYYKAQIISYGT